MTLQTLKPLWEHKFLFHDTFLYINYHHTFFWSLVIMSYCIVVLLLTFSDPKPFHLSLLYVGLGGVLLVSLKGTFVVGFRRSSSQLQQTSPFTFKRVFFFVFFKKILRFVLFIYLFYFPIFFNFFNLLVSSI